jgi:uncharacterized protein (TIGR03437 family)
MKSLRFQVIAVLFATAFGGVASAVKLERYMMLRVEPPRDCSTATLIPVSTFVTTDANAYLWFSVSGANAGDVAASEYYSPDGRLYTPASGPWQPLGQPGDWCFVDAPFQIAGAPPASLPGLWTVRVTYNGTLLFTLTFTIVSSSGGANLILNGDAEASVASASCSPPASIPGWITDGQASICKYGTGGPPDASSPGPSDRGNNYFFGGASVRAVLSQSVNVSTWAPQIDSGTQPYILSGWLGGWQDQNDNALVRANFRNVSNVILSSAVIGPVTAADRNNVTGLLLRAATGALPMGTRSIEVVLEMTRVSGSANDAYADSLSLVLSASAGCAYSVNPPTQSFGASGGTGAVSVITNSGCSWNATSNVTWITITSGAVGIGNGSVSYTVAASTSPSSRTGTLTIAGQTHTVTQAGTGPTCGYTLSAASASAPAGGGTGSVTVTTTSACSWTAISNASWITITSGFSGTGSGTVNYSVAANTTGSSRTGTLSITGLTYTVTQAAGAACTYTLLPTSASPRAEASSSYVRITAATGCAWTAVSNVTWITITSGSSGTGSGQVNYTVAANTSPSPRTGSMTIAGQTFTVTQAGAAPAGPPVIEQVVNGASFMHAALPGGSIGQGSIFTIKGLRLGQGREDDYRTGAQAAALPLGTSLAGVSIKITQGTRSVDAYPFFVWTNQINAIMPSVTPLGEVQLTVTNAGVTSAPFTVKIVPSSFGIFSVSGGAGPGIIQNYISQTDYRLNSAFQTAKPEQAVILWGTGLGAINGPDNASPPVGDLSTPVEILVGGKTVTRKLYSGRAPNFPGTDQLVFYLPADVPTGCYVPVEVKVGSNTYSNMVTMAIDAQGQRCSDAVNPYAGVTVSGGKTGAISLVRAGISAQLEAGTPALDMTLDFGLGVFLETPPGGELAYNPLTALPPRGTCIAYAGGLDVSSLLGAAAPTSLGGRRELDAGLSLSVSGSTGTVVMEHMDKEEKTGPYMGLLGGAIPIPGATSTPLFLEGGTYTISGPGGKDVGPFSTSVQFPPPATWTNRDQITSVDRAAGVTLTWTGGNPASQFVLIAGGSSDMKSNAAGGFFCMALIEGGRFAIPPPILANLPASAGTPLTDSLAGLIVGTLPSGDLPKFTARGLDYGWVLGGAFQIKTVVFR